MRGKIVGVFFVVCWVISLSCYAQDIILHLDGRTERGKVLGIPGDKIKFREEGIPKKKIKFISTETVQEISFQDGRKIYFNSKTHSTVDDIGNFISNSEASKDKEKDKDKAKAEAGNSGTINRNQSSSKSDNTKQNTQDKQALKPETKSDTDITYSKTDIKVNVPPLAFGSLAVFAERYLGKSISLQIGYNKVAFGTSGINANQKWWSITPEVRFYLNPETPLKGTYIGPYLKYWNVLRQDSLTGFKTKRELKISCIGVGTVIGRQFIVQDNLFLDIFLGMTVYVNQNLPNDLTVIQQNQIGTDYNRDFRVGLLLGFGF